MKTSLLLLLCLFMWIPISGQKIHLIESEFNPCSAINPTNSFENGLQSSSQATRIVANDFVVQAGNTFTINGIIFNFFTTDEIVAIDVAYYEDMVGFLVPKLDLLKISILFPPLTSVILGWLYIRLR